MTIEEKFKGLDAIIDIWFEGSEEELKKKIKKGARHIFYFKKEKMNILMRGEELNRIAYENTINKLNLIANYYARNKEND